MSSRGATGGHISRMAEHARPDHFLLHLSDTHLLPRGDKLYDSVSPEVTLARIFADLEDSGTRPEAIVFTGDLADHGDASAYRLLRRIVEPAAARLGAEVIWCMGNHDDRGTFRRVLFGQVANARPVDRVYDVNGLRVITMDTSVPGEHWGALSGAQLDWLAEELASPAPHGTILAMHHPPLPCIQDLAVLVELREQRELADVVEGSDVRGILAGHLHFSTNGMFAGVPVSVASATCYTQDLTTEERGTRPQDGAQSYNLVHLFGGMMLNSVVPISAGRVLSSTSAAASAAVLTTHGVVVAPPELTPVQSARKLDAVDRELEAMTAPITLPPRSE
ncbi:MAG: 3,5-cyclic-AMP phosphodiesterase [Microbacteriaceae bacterium]|jgi:Icc protein|nr:3,5-cyclic-AMP phosphodiesterase [Microbacteriaceae bacterium]